MAFALFLPFSACELLVDLVPARDHRSIRKSHKKSSGGDGRSTDGLGALLNGKGVDCGG